VLHRDRHYTPRRTILNRHTNKHFVYASVEVKAGLKLAKWLEMVFGSRALPLARGTDVQAAAIG